MGIERCGGIDDKLNQWFLQVFGPTSRECLSCREYTLSCL